MKKVLLVTGLLLLIAACAWMFLFTPDKLTPDNPASKTVYYTMIAGPGKPNENGRYDYKLTAYNSKGKEKTIGFSTGKPLQEGTYVQLYHAFIRGVTHYEVVAFEELPDAVRRQYQP